ncbi:MAG TPA: DUF4159 domain-containing protein [Gammaproteobacteria bacterium]|nr:DUF4159 domain-containing protein [Gammaproteobacteria bacterium]
MFALTLGIALACALLTPGSAQQRGDDQTAPGEFHFARMIYTDLPQYGFRGRFGGGWWRQDWPRAETHFLQAVHRLTRIDAGDPVVVQLTDDNLFDYPWLYATQVGYWDLSDKEIARLREYLLRGGFLMTDDFWGDEREVFDESMARLFPDRPIVDIPSDDPVLHVLYTIDKFTQIPGLRHVRSYANLKDLPPPQWRGIYDDDGRLMVAIDYNQDIGDSWEEADTPDYPEPMTALGYRFGINYIAYAMTH